MSASSPLVKLIADYRTGHSLERAFYFDRDIYEAELSAIYSKHWIFAGHDSEIASPGDFITAEFGGESVIVVRSKSGAVKAHINICRHRGSRICLEKNGNKKLFTCPYHAWSYDLDGKLVAARHMPEDFEPADNALHPVHVELVGGLIFINLAKDPLSLSDMRRDLGPVMKLFGFDSLQLAAKKSYTIPANWKLAVENYQECYHCTPSHAEFAQIHAMAQSPDEFAAQKIAFAAANAGSPKLAEYNKYFGYARAEQEGYQYGRNPLLPGKKSGSKDGAPVAPLLGGVTHYDGGASEFMLGPVNYFLIYDDHMVGYRFLPSAINECICDIYWLVREGTEEPNDYDLNALTWLWDITTKADEDIISNNQKGVASQYYQPGRLSKMESFQQSFIDWYLETLRRSLPSQSETP